MTVADARALGRSRRAEVPRSAHAEWAPASDRPGIVATLLSEHVGRVPELVPIRVARMAASPFAFLRGAARIMAIDLVATPTIASPVQACGDAHLGNFGLFATPERNLIFDLNDFDETLPGPWEWDVRRLAASTVVAARGRGFDRDQQQRATMATVRSYRSAVHRYAGLPALDTFYDRVDAESAAQHLRAASRERARQIIDQSRTRTSDRLLRKLTATEGDEPRIVEQPPFVVHVDRDHFRDELDNLYHGYLASLSEDRADLLRRFRVVDVARKVVGVGSVGRRCVIVLLVDPTGAPLFLQIKEAGASVLELAPDAPAPDHHGRRVVGGQRRMQAASDPFLGSTHTGDTHAYVRQLADMKGGADLDRLTPTTLADYGGLCGRVLARAHARSGDAAVIAGYLGRGDKFDRAIVEFAMRYADQNETDHATLVAAIADGEIEAAESPR